MKRWIAIIFAASLALACGDSDSDSDDGTGGSVGTGGSGGKGGSGGSGGTGGSGGSGGDGSMSGVGLEINAALGLIVSEPAWGEESNVNGMLMVTRDNEMTEAKVSVNGLDFVLNWDTFFLPPDGEQVPNAGAGKPLVIKASDDKASTELTLPCPDAFEITSPAAGERVKGGDKITLRWTGDVHTNEFFLFQPHAAAYQPTTGEASLGIAANLGDLPHGANEMEIEIPDIFTDKIVIGINVPGPFINEATAEGGENAGICWLRRWVELEYDVN